MNWRNLLTLLLDLVLLLLLDTIVVSLTNLSLLRVALLNLLLSLLDTAVLVHNLLMSLKLLGHLRETNNLLVLISG
jgi:hypothetical protein